MAPSTSGYTLLGSVAQTRSLVASATARTRLGLALGVVLFATVVLFIGRSLVDGESGPFSETKTIVYGNRYSDSVTAYTPLVQLTDHDRITSPSGQFILQMEESGNLRLWSPTHGTIMTTGTGDFWPHENNTHELRLDNNIAGLAGIGGLSITIPEKTMHVPNPKVYPNLFKAWVVGSAFPACANASRTSHSRLQLYDDGSLILHPKNDTQPACLLSPPVPAALNHTIPLQTIKDIKIAVIIAGLYRTNANVCKSHVEKLMKDYTPDQLDVFFLTYAEETGGKTKEEIEKSIRDCYGPYLKGIEIRALEKVAEPWDFDTIPLAACSYKASRLLSQLKSIWLGAGLMRDYMLQHGRRYDYIVRWRPDNDFWGTIPSLTTIGDASRSILRLPVPAMERYVWCMRHDGSYSVQGTDQIAYGRASTMNTYLDFYLSFVDFMRRVDHRDNPTKAKHSFLACDGQMAGRDKGDLIDSGPTNCWDRCSIECILGYYLDMVGIVSEPIWNWQQNILRGDGNHAKVCELGYNCG